jgi:ABC-type phosphate transport system substrate-binding protein
MNRSKVAAVATALLVGVVTVAGATSASADTTPQSRDIVGVGSDTIQYALNNLADGAQTGATFTAGYNAFANGRLVSFNALNPSVPTSDTAAIHDTITLKAGTAPITRPDGSGAGKALLFGAGNNTGADFARSSSALSATEVAGNLTAFPFALDELAAAVSAQSTNAPAAISVQQLVSIYQGTVTNWNQIGGQNGVIVPALPQTGSGTRTFFLGQLQAANGGVAIIPAASVISVQEHDPAAFNAAPNLVAPFSVGRAGMANATGLVHLESGTANDLHPSFTAQRAVYDVVRTADATKASITGLFGTDGFLCSASAQSLIVAAGLKQLSVPLDGGVCGTKVTTTAAVSNFLTNP